MRLQRFRAGATSYGARPVLYNRRGLTGSRRFVVPNLALEGMKDGGHQETIDCGLTGGKR